MVLTMQAVELLAHSYAPRLDAQRRRRPGKLVIARRPIQPRRRLTVYHLRLRARVLLATPPQRANFVLSFYFWINVCNGHSRR